MQSARVFYEMTRFGRRFLLRALRSRHAKDVGRITALVPVSKWRCAGEPLESRVMLAGIPPSYAQALDNQINGLITKVGAIGVNTPVPGIGKSIGQVCGVTNVFSGFRSNIAGALSDPTSGNGKEELRSALFAELGTYLADRTGDGQVTRDDIDIPIYDVPGNNLRVVMTLDHTDNTYTCSLGTALPSLPFKITSGAMIVTPGFHFDDFTFGLTGGNFFWDTSRLNELKIRIDAQVDRNTPIVGSMGFMQVTATDSAVPGAPRAATNVLGTFTADVSQSGGVPMLGTQRFTAQTRMGLNIATINTAPIDSKQISPPDTRFGFREAWDFVNADPSAGYTTWGNPPTVNFDNVEVNLGGFLNRLMRPVMKDVQKLTRQLQPIYNALQQDVPILSDLSEAVGGDPIKLIQLTQAFVDSGILPQGISNLLNTTIKLVQASNVINQINLDDTSKNLVNNAWLPLGSFDLSINPDLRTLPASLFDKTVANWNSLQAQTSTNIDLAFVENWIHTNVAQPLGDQINTIINTFNGDDAQDGAWVNWPILDNPKQGIYKLLLGQNTDLVKATFRLQNSPLNIDFTLPTPILGIDARFSCHIDFDILVRGGYDTFGIREFTTSANPQPVVFRDGLWIDPALHAHVDGFIGVGAQTDTPVISLFALGGVAADFKADPVPGLVLPDPTKARPYLDLTSQPYIMNVTGGLEVTLRVGARIGIDFPWPVGFVGIEPSYDFGLYNLLNFNVGVPNPFYYPDAPIAVLDPTTHVLTLNMGSAARRTARGVASDQIDEAYRVAVLTDENDPNAGARGGGAPGVNGTQDLLITAFGVTASYPGVTRIVADGDDGNDIIDVNADVSVPVSITGGAGDDKIHYLGSGDAVIDGGAGNDEIVGGSGNNTITGGLDNDQLSGGSGQGVANIVDGGAGDDRVAGGPGPATLIGGPGNDQLIGSNFDDTIDGGDGNDTINAQAGNDSITGGIGLDYIDAGPGNDTISAGGDADLVQAGDGDDSINGDDGADSIFGGIGHDIIDGGNDSDYLVGTTQGQIDTAGNTITGGAGNDFIVGGNFADSVDAGSEDDAVFTAAGDDTAHGGTGNDSIHGSDGNDLIYGDDGADQLFGDLGTDSIEGGAGGDSIEGNDGNDTLLGQDDNDTISGGLNDDVISGGRGTDQITGDAGNDLVRGGAGADSIDAGTGSDVMFGDAGNDSVWGNLGADRIDGGGGNDVLYSFAPVGTDDTAPDTIRGGAQNDMLFGGTGGDYLDGGAGVDTVAGAAGNDTILGGGGVGDSLSGGANDDLILGSDDGASSDPNFADAILFGDSIDAGDGNDTVYANAGADLIIGGIGNDSIDAGAGADSITGGDGNDFLYGGFVAGGGSPGDSISGDAGSDTIWGSENNDTLSGGTENDSILAQGGSDSITGDAGDDIIDSGGGNSDFASGGAGNDEINDAGGANNTLQGDAGDDILRGADDGADSLLGGAGRDRMFGRGGNDTLLGGTEADTIYGNAGDDLISGEAGADLLLGGENNDTIYGQGSSGAGDDNAVDSLYGDLGTNGNEANSGRDQLFGQGGNDLMYGEGGLDSISGGGGANNLISYGPGGSTTPEAYSAPATTPAPTIVPVAPLTLAGATLESGVDYRGRWTEFASSASRGGVSTGRAGAIEPSAVVASGNLQYIAWADARRGNYEIYVARHTPGAGWQELAGSAEEGGISNSLASSRRPSITLDPSGNPIVAWTESSNTGAADVRVARYDGANWVALGSSLTGGGISNTGTADRPAVVTTAGGTVVAWLDSTGGVTNVFARRFSGGTWQEFGGIGSGSGTGISANGAGVNDFSLATDGTKATVAWSALDGAGINQVYLREFNGSSSWNALGTSLGGSGLSNTLGDSTAPSVAYLSGTPFVAWQDDSTGPSEIYAARFTGGAWAPAGAMLNVSNTHGDASAPHLASGGGSLHLTWTDETLVRGAGAGGSIYATRWTGSAFAPEVATDNSGNGATTLHGAASDTGLTVDPSGRPYITWSDSASVGGQQAFLRGSPDSVVRIFNANSGTTVQSILDGNTLGAGDVIVVSGSVSGFTIGSADIGVTIIGQFGATISGAVTVNAANVTIEGVTISGALSVNAANFTARESSLAAVNVNAGANAAQVIGGSAGLITIAGGASSVAVEHNKSVAGLTVVAGGATNISARDNVFTATVSLANAASGAIRQNRINAAGTGLNITAAFSGLIEDNDITGTSVGVNYAAAATLSNNRIFGSGTGVTTNISGGTNGFGFAGAAQPNQIFNNTTGVVLNNGWMQNQHVYSNTTGVSGTGQLGGTSLDLASLIELNGTGVNIAGTIQYNRIARNGTGIFAHANQTIAHNLIYDNTQYGLRVSGVSNVPVFNNTFATTTGDDVFLGSAASDVQLINNVIVSSAASGYAINVSDDSRGGFSSDYNLLHSTGSAKLVHWLRDYNDILDWQSDIVDFDEHSRGRTVINPDLSDPGFLNRAWGDFRTFPIAAGQRTSGPTTDAGTSLADVGVDVSRTNLLSNPSFETGTTGWTVNVGGTTQTSSPAPWDGTKYFTPGAIQTGIAEQTLDLTTAGYTTAQLDSQDLVLTFGGRVRTIDESSRIILAFLNGSNATIGTPVTIDAHNTADRWELVGGRSAIPSGTRSVRFHFESNRNTAASNDTYFDGAFVYVESENNAPDLGAFGNTSSDVAQAQPPHLALRTPDLYTDLPLAQPLVIRWDSFGNTGDSLVRIDLLQDTPDGPAVLQNLTPGTPDTGEFTWIPQSSGLAPGTGGLRIQVSLAADNISLDRSSEPSSVPDSVTNYYVDDASNANDQYTPNAVGDNRNTGKSPTSPKASLAALLAAYDLNPGDTVYVDTGDYTLTSTLKISGTAGVGDDEGVIITGPTGAGQNARIAPSGFSTGALIELNAADFTSISHLSLLGGTQYGLWVRNGSTNNVANDITQSGATLDGIRVESDSAPMILDHLDVSGNARDGVSINSATAGVSNSRFYNNTGRGLFVAAASPDAKFESDEAFGNNFGIAVTTLAPATNPVVIGNADLTQAKGNKVYNNSTSGIVAFGQVQVAGNTVYGHNGTTGRGIDVQGNANATKNVVYSNRIGIYGGGATFNRVFNNILYGIYSTNGSGPVTGNVVYSNGTGVYVSFASNAASTDGPDLRNNLIYANATRGVWITGGRNATVYNNTVYQPAGDAVFLEPYPGLGAANIRVINNIFQVASGYGIKMDAAAQSGLTSNNNLFYTTGTGKVGFWSGADRTTLSAWRSASQQDAASLSGDPLYVDADGADNQLGYTGGADQGADDDFHERSPGGSAKGGSLAPVLNGTIGLPVDNPGNYSPDTGTQSPAIDHGDPTFAFANEPTPNGGFVNIGAFGNTNQASKSPGQYVLVDSPNGGETWVAGQTFAIKWREEVTGTGSVKLELMHLIAGGGSPGLTLETVINATAPNTGTFNWTIPSGLAQSGDYVVRVTRNDNPAISDISDGTFSISAATNVYYVNDGTNQVGDFTTAPGNDANDGLTPTTPKLTLQALLNAYDFGPGDVVRVDRGTYALTTNVNVLNDDSGVRIEGFVDAGNKVSVLNRGNTNSGNVGIDLQNADNVTIANLAVTGGNIGIRLNDNADSDNVTLSGVESFGNNGYGVYVGATNDAFALTGSRIHDNGPRGLGLSSNNATVTDNDVFNQTAYDIDASGAGHLISGNRLYAAGRSGVLAAGAAGNSPIVIQGNDVHDNSFDGIEMSGNVQAIGNTVYRQTAAGAGYGILAPGGSEIRGNVVYDNLRGINGGTQFANLLITGNRVFNNSVRGIEVTAGVTVDSNQVYNNGVGIYGSWPTNAAGSGPFIRNNLSYQNTTAAIQLDGGSSGEIVNNTVYQPTGNGIVLNGNLGTYKDTIKNNVVVISTGTGLAVANDTHTGLVIDYNDVQVTGAGHFASYGSTTYDARGDWFFDLGFDQHSLTANPQFADINGPDNLLGYTGGVDHGADDDFSLQPGSSAIDAGDPQSFFLREPQPNGGRTNLGHQGNTPLATPSNAKVVQVLSPNGLEKLGVGAPYTVQVATQGLGLSAPVAQINAGGATIGQWLASQYASNFQFQQSYANAINLSGVTNPAPQSVYQSILRGFNTTNSPVSFQLPVPDGTYTLRLHFMEPDFGSAGGRLMDIKVNGVVQTANFDIFAAAGASYKAVTVSYTVTASGGNGISLDLVNKNNNPAIISGVELSTTTAGGASPAVNLDASYDNGANWTSIATNVPVDSYGRGSFAWTPTTASDNALIRVRDANSPASDVSDASFVVGAAGNDYYLNDGSTTGDVFTTAVGSDSNSGRSADKPMRTLAALLGAYDLGPGDVIHVDAGTYNLAGNVTFSPQDSGVRIEGPQTGPLSVTFNRGNTANPVFDLNGIDNVTFDHLRLTGGSNGIMNQNSADVPDGVTFSNGEIFGNSNAAFYLFNATNVTVTGSTIRNNFYGFYFSYSAGVINVSNNTFNANTSNAIVGAANVGTVSGNIVSNNGGQGGAINIGGFNQIVTISGNTVFGSPIGIGAGSNTTMTGNTVYGSTDPNNGIGIRGFGTFNNTISNNVVSGFGYGIYGGGLVTGNRVFNNKLVGIELDSNNKVIGNVVYSNGIGLEAQGTNGPLIQNNLIYGNTTAAVRVVFPYDMQILGNTIYQPTGDGIRLEGAYSGRTIPIKSNIIQVNAGSALWLANEQLAGLASDYNTIYTPGAGKLATANGRDFTSRAQWFYETRQDRNSLTSDPQFVDADGADNALGFTGGVDHGTDDNFQVQPTSPTIDAGDPSVFNLNEPAPNGNRINQGYTGNTSQAVVSPAQTIQLLSPNGFEKFEAGSTQTIRWTSNGLTQQRTVALLNGGTRNNLNIGNFQQIESYGTFSPAGQWSNYGNAINTSGVTNPPPLDVYQTYAYASNGVGNVWGYTMPLADGNYTMRLHMVEPFVTGVGQRVFDVRVNGVVVQPNVDMYALAGNQNNKAVAISIPVTITGGQGLHLELVNKTSNGALFFGMEILAPEPTGVATPTATLEYSTDNGGSWNTITTSAPIDSLGRGSFDWTVPNTLSDQVLIRVRANQGMQPQDASNAALQIVNNGVDYYVNDGSQTGDVFSTAVGDNANSGKSPDKPMASLAALLDEYDLNPGDVVHVDAGAYSLIQDITLDAQDSGMLIQGPTGAATATFDRAARSTPGTHVFQFTGADDVTIERLTMINAYHGVEWGAGGNLVADSDRNTIRDSNLSLMGEAAFYDLNSADDDNVITRNTIHDISAVNGVGVFNRTNRLTVSNNQIFNMDGAGIDSAGPDAVITGNTTFGNRYGIRTSGRNGLVSGNTVRNNSLQGIDASGAFDSFATISNNEVFANPTGIHTISYLAVVGNRVYGNSNYGIDTSSATSVELRGNQVYSNATGIRVLNSSTVSLLSNLVYANTTRGVSIESSTPAIRVWNNTVYSIVGDAIRLTSSASVSLSNNILWVEAGSAINVDAASQTGFTSDRNVLYRGAGAGATIGVWAGTTRTTLGDWQTASSQDANSSGANPIFVDLDGADNVLGYRTTPTTFDGGRDDNFFLAKNSPAIDHGDSWNASHFDFDGSLRADDPGTANTGTADYAAADAGSNQFTATGTAKGWKSANTWFTLTLPFSFSLYGTSYSTVNVGTNGLLQFGSTGVVGNPANSTAGLASAATISALWDDIRTTGATDDVFVDTSVADQVKIRWNASRTADGSDVQFAVVLFSDGRMRFDYGPGNTNLTPTVGISGGSGQAYQLFGYDGQATLTNANSVNVNFTPGIADIGALEFRGSSNDVTPPTVVSSTPAGVHAGGNVSGPVTQVVLTLNEPVNRIDAAALANYDLRSAGADGVFDTGDDILLTPVPQYVDGSSNVTLVLSSTPLPNGNYRLTVRSNAADNSGLHDRSGLLLDGDANGTAGGNYVRTFTIGAATQPPTVVASGFNWKTPTGQPQSMFVQFDKDVHGSLTTDDLVLMNTTTGQTISAGAMFLSYDAGTNTATITFPGLTGKFLPDGNYTARVVAAGVTDGSSAMASDYLFDFYFLAGDANHDRHVDLTDFTFLASNFNKSGKTFADGDFSYDGVVDLTDFTYLAANFNKFVAPAPAPDAPAPAAQAAARPAAVPSPQIDAPQASVDRVIDDVLQSMHDAPGA